jgi:hypothetical protein
MNINTRLITWLPAIQFRQIYGWTIDKYNGEAKKWKLFDKPILKKKGKTIYVNIPNFEEWLENDDN